MTLNRWGSIAALLGLVLGCSAEEEGAGTPLGDVPMLPVPGCEVLDHTACNVSEGLCQARLLQLAACLRGNDPGDLPPIDTIDKSEYARRWTEALDANPRPEPDHEEDAFVLLGLIPPDGFGTQALVTEGVSFVGGFYDPDSKSITLVDAGEELSERDWSSVLVHEFIHMLQDREFPFEDRDTQYVDSEDAWFALRALTEGEAKFHQIRYLASVSGFDPAHLALDAFFSNRVSRAEEALARSEAPYLQAPYQFPYDWGGRYLEHAFQTGGLAAIHERFVDPPTTTHELMASSSDLYVPDFEPTTLEEPEAPVAWLLAQQHRLGALGTFLALGQRLSDPGRARELALAWRGDQLFIYGDADAGDATALVWRLDFVDEASAASVASAFSTSARANGTRVTIAETNGSTGLDWAF